MPGKKAVVVGAGFGGLTSAALLAKHGFEVTVLEKNAEVGGRARTWKENGFSFDMGPSWYLMPEVFEDFFKAMGRKRSDYYELTRLDPGYRVYFGGGERLEITADIDTTLKQFDILEKDGARKLRKYLDVARYQYEVAMREFMYLEYRSLFQFMNARMMTEGLKLHVFDSLDGYVERFFKDRRAKQILEYSTVFLGSSPKNTPALYSLMSHLDMEQGVYYPMGGMGKVVDGLVKLCEEFGVKIVTESPVTKVRTDGTLAKAVVTPQGEIEADLFLMNADYRHAEMDLLDKPQRNYSERYWKSRTIAPTLLMIYLGLNRKVPDLLHHNLSFSENWNTHFDAIFKKPAWPENPNLYISCTSKTDDTVAPGNGENIVILVPLAAGLDDSDLFRESYVEKLLDQVERITGQGIRDAIVTKRIYSGRDYSADYNAYKGSALGLAHTLLQTAIFRPSQRNRKIGNLYYSGQYTHPGIGVPMTFISSKIVSDTLAREHL